MGIKFRDILGDTEVGLEIMWVTFIASKD